MLVFFEGWFRDDVHAVGAAVEVGLVGAGAGVFLELSRGFQEGGGRLEGVGRVDGDLGGGLVAGGAA